MQPSPNIHAELKRCKELLQELGHATSATDFEDKWQRFLGHLERVWNKCVNHFGKSPKWNGWKGRFEIQRRTDPLLSYLTNARGAHEHTVTEITEKKPGSIGIGPGPSGRVHIKHLEIGPQGIRGEWDGDLAVTFIPDRVEPAPVKNRGRVYSVPTSHLGVQLMDTSATTFAMHGLAYYQNLVAEAEKFFVKRNGLV